MVDKSPATDRRADDVGTSVAERRRPHSLDAGAERMLSPAAMSIPPRIMPLRPWPTLVGDIHGDRACMFSNSRAARDRAMLPDSAAGSRAFIEDAPRLCPLQPVDWGPPLAISRGGQRSQRQGRAAISPEPELRQKKTRYLSVERTGCVRASRQRIWVGVLGV